MSNAPVVPAYTAFNAALAFIWRPENDGQPAHATPGDSGGLTAWGATYGAFNAYLARTAQKPCTPNEFSAMDRDGFRTFYAVEYWQGARCTHMPAAAALVVFDAAVLSGAGHASRMVQRAVSVDPDGIIGPVTLAALDRAWGRSPSELLVSLYSARLTFYAEHCNPEFVAGWRRRAKDCLLAADDMVPPALTTPETRLAVVS
jgi:lysozyme family protein